MSHRKILITALAVMCTAFPAFATDAGTVKEIKPLTVSRLGDTELSCHALEREALAMRSIIRTQKGIEKESDMKSQGIGAAGAVGSILLGTLTAGVGLAAAGFIANEAVESEADHADTIKETAAQRRSLMVGIYHAKGCEGAIDHVMDDAPARKRKATTAMVTLEEPRTAAPVMSKISPASGQDPVFSFNE